VDGLNLFILFVGTKSYNQSRKPSRSSMWSVVGTEDRRAACRAGRRRVLFMCISCIVLYVFGSRRHFLALEDRIVRLSK